MTPKISLITAVAVVALTVAVPAAFGEGRLAGSPEPAVAVSPELKALMARSEGLNKKYGLGEFAQNRVSTTSPSQRAEMLRSEGLNRLYGLGEFAAVSSYRDAFERGVANGQLDLSTFNSFERATPVQGLDSNISTYRDAFERGTPVAGSPDVPTITSGREIAWPQIGIGFGVGLLLALGLGLAMRMTPIRPAH